MLTDFGPEALIRVCQWRHRSCFDVFRNGQRTKHMVSEFMPSPRRFAPGAMRAAWVKPNWLRIKFLSGATSVVKTITTQMSVGIPCLPPAPHAIPSLTQTLLPLALGVTSVVNYNTEAREWELPQASYFRPPCTTRKTSSTTSVPDVPPLHLPWHVKR